MTSLKRFESDSIISPKQRWQQFGPCPAITAGNVVQVRYGRARHIRQVLLLFWIHLAKKRLEGLTHAQILSADNI
ncbi:MAG: hypothetical protein AAGJ50_08290 [Pseudomonadota bacterium]